MSDLDIITDGHIPIIMVGILTGIHTTAIVHIGITQDIGAVIIRIIPIIHIIHIIHIIITHTIRITHTTQIIRIMWAVTTTAIMVQ